jgi:2-oxoglutarate dehydrogenase E1 component
VVIGMAHRGRLNVLANIVGKPYEKIFNEFEGQMDPRSAHGSGDVKYHLGQTGKYTTPDGEHATTVSVVANPSHLEAVDPVLEGIVRAKQDRLDLGLHGYTCCRCWCTATPAFAGQGVVAETLNLSQLRGTAPAARCTWSSTTRSASPPRRSTAARRSTRPTWPG